MTGSSSRKPSDRPSTTPRQPRPEAANGRPAVLVGERFSRDLRVRKKADFDRVYAVRRYASDGWLIVNAVPNDLPHPRLGLAVGKPVGNAVVRGRWKRRLREAFRRNRSQFPVGFDYVVRPRPGTNPTPEQLVQSLIALAQRVARTRREKRE
jgi:ribonuclease P protein component